MRSWLARTAEPLALLGILMALAWALHSLLVPVRVAGRSMVPALYPGDLALVAQGRPPGVGDVALLEVPGHMPVLHRVVALEGGVVRTRGDANSVADWEPVANGNVRGRCVLVVPLGGLIERWQHRGAYATMGAQPNSSTR